ncbi:MAG: hypothetical protein OHK93_007372 [Ramalina farinacea]|uniref:Beta-ketoacyl synthase-like N-terminal domain-containing protein n=1 Tax=Ramalina farinacea TaxID=258253 RepID=A0AA43QKC7_9LECA|nr:hypothetical protein [Ramalina farinacea]
MATNGKSRAASQPIAIVGMACRFPGDATSPSKLWDLCAAGRDGWSTIPHDRFDVKSFYDADDEKIGRVGRVQAEIVKSHVLGGHFLKDDVARFDAGFFNLPTDVSSVSGRPAEPLMRELNTFVNFKQAMDPQIRILLENVYEATEDG